MFRHMCILAGCDYLPAMHGVGVKKAYGLLKKYRTVERVRVPSFSPSSSFPNKLIQ